MRARSVMSVVVLAVAVLLGGGRPGVAATDTVIATLPAQTKMDALDGHVLWSVPTEGGGWQLIDYSQGVQHRLPVAGFVEPVDVDLGRDRHGRLVAVYSRCRRRLALDGGNFGRRGCDVFRYRFATAREHKIKAVSSRFDDIEPTLWGARIAFVRGYPARRYPVNERIYMRNLRPGGRTRRLRGGSPAGSPWDMDLRARTATVRWVFEYGDTVRLHPAGSRSRVLLSTPGSGAAAQVYSTLHPTFVDRHTVYWGLASDDPDWAEVWRRDIRKRRVEHATTRINAPFVLFAQDADISYYAVSDDHEDDTSPLQLHRLDGLTFKKAPKLTLD
jgi:hypothetical protein